MVWVMDKERDVEKPTYRVNVRFAPVDSPFCGPWEVTLPEIKQTTRCFDLPGVRAAAEKIVGSAMGVGLGDFSLGPVVQVVDDGVSVVDVQVLEHHFTTWTRIGWGYPEVPDEA